MYKRRLFIIHGWEGHPRIHWLGWLADEATKLGWQAIAPAFPNPKLPQCSEWMETMKEAVGVPTENDYFIGHSLGMIAILQYLRTLKGDQQVGGVGSVAGFATTLGIPQIASFFESPVELKALKSKAKQGYVAIYSDDDPYVPVAKAEEMREGLGAKRLMLKGAGHINEEKGFEKLPEALEVLKGWV